MLKFFSTIHRRPSASTPMNRSTNTSFQEYFPGEPSPDYQSTETQHQATSASGGPNSQTPGRTPGNTGDKPSQAGVDVVPEHSVVSRRPDFASAQSIGNTSSDTPPQPAQYSDIEGKRPPARGSPLEPSSGAATAARSVAADPKPILHVKSASEDSGYLSRGPSDTARPPENPAPSAPAGGGDALRTASFATRRTNRSLATNGSAFANGAATTKNGPPDVDPSLQARAASAEDELKPRDKAVISKEESTSSSRVLGACMTDV